jgi:DNA polymerase alpha subunit B
MVVQPAIKFNATPQRPAVRVSSATPDSVQGSPDLAQSQNQSQAEPGNSFLMRGNRGQVTMEMHSELGKRGLVDLSDSKPLGLRCRVTHDDADFENVEVRYRYMYTNLVERGNALEKQLLKMQSAMCAMAQLSEDDLNPVGVPSQELVWVCGRICVSAPTGRLNKASVVLEGSRRDSGGRRIMLDLSEVSYSVFPGQVVLVEGLNSTGRSMTVKRIVTGASAPLPRSLPNKLLDYHYSKFYQGSKPLSVLVAAGPYTTSDNLDYHPLRQLLVNVYQTRPDVVIMLGPFVDIAHPMLSTGDIKLLEDVENPEAGSHSASYHMVFVERVLRDGLQEMFGLEEDSDIPISTNFIMIPSLNDAHHDFVFPQPPLNKTKPAIQSPFTEEKEGEIDVPYSNEKDPKRRVHMLPNPCMFR